tara:strand:- start:1303 stop:1641 length:339 start_codon:yes stop_codon:yes gene_type:complete
MDIKSFQEVLAGLDPVDDLDGLDLSVDGENVGKIPNSPGKTGSLAVYAHLVGHKDGVIGTKEAAYGLELFAEHTKDAEMHPGKHPNIDRLREIIIGAPDLDVQVRYREEAGA